MKPIRVDEKNLQKMQEVIDSVQKRSRERNISAEDVIKGCSTIDNTFSIPKKYMAWVVVSVDLWADKYAKAYKYTPVSTQFTVERRPTGWYLVDVRREATGRSLKKYKTITMPADARNAIVENYMSF